MSEEQTYNTPLSQQIESALEYYEDLATRGHHWNSLVVAAIKSYNPSKDQQIKGLEELLILADNVLMYSKDRPPLASNHYYDKKQSYQQKYPKP